MGSPYSVNNANRAWKDDYDARKRRLAECLERIAELGPPSVAFPHGVACGLAGGNWERDCLPRLRAFASENPSIIAAALHKL